MNIQEVLTEKVKEAFETLYNTTLDTVEFQTTRKDFEGDITIVVFPMLSVKKMNPAQLGEELGAYLTEHVSEISSFNVVKGFLNLVIDDSFYLNFFANIVKNDTFGHETPKAGERAVMVEYSSPNTNKPLHLGHIRNNLLGYSVAEIIKASGKKVYKTQIINDRGIHICKSMLAWQRFGNGETPQSTGLKGDKLVGNYYVEFEKVFQLEYTEWLTTTAAIDKIEVFAQKPETQKYLEEKFPEKYEDGSDLSKEIVAAFRKSFKNEYFANISKIGTDAQQMLLNWEAGDEEVVALWKKMNQWVYDGFATTYTNLGVDFDALYYESDTYLLGKDVVQAGMEKGVFYAKEDGSVWCDLTDDGLDEKIVLRSDGTAVYMTQDIGTAIQRVKDYPDIGGMIYTVGNEQDYHFKVLFLILKKLGFDWSKNLDHLSYGMVDLPSGKMKSREGTVVDADDLMIEMSETAKEISQELGKLEGYTDEEKDELYKIIGMGALKYFILKVDPKKRILFDPKESIDFAGNTGPFIQYTYARIQSILRKADFDYSAEIKGIDIDIREKEIVKQLQGYPAAVQLAAANQSPAVIANYTYDLVKLYNSFFQNIYILGEEDEAKKVFRVQLSKKVGDTIKAAFGLLGIEVPERM